jgi:Cd2+/Zn2+-exporting ATPase
MKEPKQLIEWRVANLDCENEAAQIRRLLETVEGVKDLKIYPKSAKVILEIDPQRISPDEVNSRLSTNGFPVLPSREIAPPPKPWRNPKVVTSALSGVILGITYLFEQTGIVHETAAYVLYGAGSVIGGYYFGREAIEELVEEFEVGIELLMSAAAIAAFILGQPAEALTLVFLYSISEALESYTEAKTRNAIRALMDLSPKFATVRHNGQEMEIPVEEIAVGEVFIVRPGQAIPTDGKVIRGSSSVNQAPVTGESIPVEKEVGNTVFAGTINEEGALEVEATKTFENNTLARIIHLVEEAQEEKGKSERFIRRFGKRYSPAVLLIGVAIAIVPGLLGEDWVQWAIRATVFVVAAAPCALVISVPITMVAALGTGARQGVLVKGGVYLEELAKVKVVALDKTGTLTLGKPEVTDVVSLGNEPEDEVLKLAAAVEHLSQHPLAKAINEQAAARNLSLPKVDGFQSVTGLGVSGSVNGEAVFVGSPEYYSNTFSGKSAKYQTEIDSLRKQGKTVILVGTKAAALGLIAVRDRIRPNAREALAAMRKDGIRRIIMLTGDNSVTAAAIAQEAGVDETFAELKPEDKSRIVNELEEKYGRVMMVGDGVNDAPALAAATVGVAMGAAGTDVAMETADVALMGDDLSRLPYALHLAHRTKSVVQQNLALSMIVIAILILGSLSDAFTLPVAVLGHELSELAVIASGLRLLKA